MLGSVSDFVLHAAKQNGSAILAGISRCWCFPVFPWKRVHSLTLVATPQPSRGRLPRIRPKSYSFYTKVAKNAKELTTSNSFFANLATFV